MEEISWLSSAISWFLGLFMGYGLKIGVDNRRAKLQQTKTKQDRNIVTGKQAGRDIVER